MEMKICTACGKEKPKTKEFWHKRIDGADGYRNVCKECLKNKNKVPKPIVKEGYKICSRCKRELPATKEYFHRSEKTNSKIKLESRCKECLGTTFIKDRIKPKEGYKICSGCKKEKKANNKNFYTESKASDGLTSKCKECRKVEDRKRFQIKYYENNEMYKNKAKKYRETHKEDIKKYNKKYISKPKAKEIRNINTIKYRANKKKLESKYTIKEWENTKQHFECKCAYCGQELPLEQEHFIPISKGGEYTINNIIPACRSCNSSKSNKDFFKWYPQQEFYSKEREKKIMDFLNYNKNVQQLKMC